MQEQSSTLDTPDGFPLHVLRWTPEGAVRGVVQIAHGMAEHAARYKRFAEALTGRGYAVIAHDHRGHGRSVRSEDDRGHFADVDGWRFAVADLARVTEAARAAWPGRPVGLFAHSMGSSLALSYLQGQPGAVRAAVLSGPTGKVGPLRAIGRQIAGLERLRLGRRGRSALLQAMSFGDFNKAFEPARTPFDWLSRDPVEVDAYVADPWCGFMVTTQHWCDHLDALGEIVDPARIARMAPDVPLLVVAGEADPVSARGAQIGELVRRLRLAGVRRVELRLWPEGRHELLNDTVRDEVTAFVLAWLDDTLGG